MTRSNVKIYDKPQIHEASMPNHDRFFLPFDLGNTPLTLPPSKLPGEEERGVHAASMTERSRRPRSFDTGMKGVR